MHKTYYVEEVEAGAPPRPRQSIPIEDVCNPLILKGLELWQERAGAKAMPSRADLSPRVLAGLLRNTGLVRVLDGGTEFEIRIVGDAQVTAQGASFQGMTTAEIDLLLPGYGMALNAIYRRASGTGKPAAFRGWYVREADGHALYHESIVLPMSDDGCTVDHLLVVAVYAMQPGGVLR